MIDCGVELEPGSVVICCCCACLKTTISCVCCGCIVLVLGGSVAVLTFATLLFWRLLVVQGSFSVTS
jgi:hypothetical protein